MQSLLARSLYNLMIGTNVGSRQTWSYLLEIEQAQIQEWFDDQAFPTAAQLNTIIFELDKTTAPQSPYYQVFMELKDEPFHELSPLAPAGFPTLRDYLKT